VKVRQYCISGLDKTHHLFEDYKNFVFNNTEVTSQTAIFDIVANGEYRLIAKSGLSFDSSVDNLQAAYYNVKKLSASIFGIFSSTLEKKIKESDCYLELGKTIYHGNSGIISIKESLKSVQEGTRPKILLIKDILKYIKGNAGNVMELIEKCDSKYERPETVPILKSGFFGKIFSFIDVISKLESAFNGGAMFGDWLLYYDSEIEYCFTKTGDIIEECVPNYNLEAISDLQQIGAPDAALDKPLMVRVTDELGQAVENAEVVWETDIGSFDFWGNVSGTVQPEVSLTDKDGIAQAEWTLGPMTCGTNSHKNVLIASLNGKTKFGPKITFYASKPAFLIQVSGNNSGGVHGTPINGNVSISINGNTLSWTIWDSKITGHEPSDVSLFVSLPNTKSFDLNGTITTSFNRPVYLSVGFSGCRSDATNRISTSALGKILSEPNDPNQEIPFRIYRNE